MGLGLVTAPWFTSALSNGPKIQNEKWLWTDYSRLNIKHLLRWDLSPLPVHGADSRCWRQFRDALHVAGTCFKRTFPQLRRPPSPCQPCEKWCTSQKKRSYFQFAPPPTPESPRQDRFKVLPTPGPKWQPRPQDFSLKKWLGRPTHFLREKHWGRGCPNGWTCSCGCAGDSNRSN